MFTCSFPIINTVITFNWFLSVFAGFIGNWIVRIL